MQRLLSAESRSCSPRGSPSEASIFCATDAPSCRFAGRGKRLTLRVAGPGEVLGLGAALSNTRYEITAELIDSSQVVFVRRKDLMKFLRENPDVCMQVVRMLSQDLHGAYERVRSIGMVRTRRPRTIVRPRAILA